MVDQNPGVRAEHRWVVDMELDIRTSTVHDHTWAWGGYIEDEPSSMSKQIRTISARCVVATERRGLGDAAQIIPHAINSYHGRCGRVLPIGNTCRLW